MSGLFRSEDMTYVRCLMNEETARETMRDIGKFGSLHLVDNASMESVHFKDYKRRAVDCAQWLTQIDQLKTVCSNEDVQIEPADTVADADFEHKGDLLDAAKEYFKPIQDDLTVQVNFKQQRLQMINEEIEKAAVLQMCNSSGALLARPPQQERQQGSYGSMMSLNAPVYQAVPTSNFGMDTFSSLDDMESQREFSNSITGALPASQQPLFQRMLFRLTRGNVFTRFMELPEPIIDPSSGEAVSKVVFSVVFLGSQLRRRVEQTCKIFSANIYNVPDDSTELQDEIQAIERRLKEYGGVVRATSEQINKSLQSIAAPRGGRRSALVNWYAAITDEAAVCTALQQCGVASQQEGSSSSLLVALGWVPSDEVHGLRIAIDAQVRKNQAILETRPFPSSPPTYIKTGKYTSVFQGIVDTYGVPRYQEANPGLFTIVTFPFLFGVMYSDIGHGFCLFLMGCYMVYTEKHYLQQAKLGKVNEIFLMAFEGRYMIVLMGAFATYCGLIYNDCLSNPIDLFGTRWEWEEGSLEAVATGDSHYPFGVDPSWYHTENELLFFNSLKMKLSVTLGVLQMMFGIVLSLTNHLHNKDTLSIIFEFIPRMVFLTCTFGYMVFLILFKMCTDYSDGQNGTPPNLVQMLIGLFLDPTNVDPDEQMYAGQPQMQVFLRGMMLLAVPMMLIPQPLITNRQVQARLAAKAASMHPSHDGLLGEESEEKSEDGSQGGDGGGGHGHGSDEEYDLSDHFIEQGIHTIEFVLGTVSNTASYLRLWALSLAHSELSTVFWDKMILDYGITNNPVMGFVGMAAWCGATFSVLLCMDALECFLHALRLHWVEFQNKFFHADGYAFRPFKVVLGKK